MNEVDQLITQLAQDLDIKKAKPKKTVLKILLWACFTLGFSYLVASFLVGIRYDFTKKMDVSSYMIELGLAMAVFISAAMATAWLSTPDGRQQKWVWWLPFVPLTLLSIMLIDNLLSHEIDLTNVKDSLHCFTEYLIIVLIPTIMLALVTIKGRTTNFLLSSFMTVLTVSSMGYLWTRIMCSIDEVGHLLLWHQSPIILTAIILAFLGMRLFRW